MTEIAWLLANYAHVLKWLAIITMTDGIVKQVALKHGYTKLASICDFIADHISFVVDLVGNLGSLFSVFKPVSAVPIKVDKPINEIIKEQKIDIK